MSGHPDNTFVLWEAKPHTLAKIAILKRYLQAWFSIMGRKSGGGILYIDGFAGPGEYTNTDEGSPIAGLAAAEGAINAAGSGWKAGTVYFEFIDADVKAARHLEARLAERAQHSRLQTRVLPMTFAEGIQQLRRERPAFFEGNSPMFVFIDPFGAKGVPFDIVSQLLASPCSEVLINVDEDGITRNLDAGNDALISSIFGGECWRDEIDRSAKFAVKCRQVIKLYKSRLQDLPGVKYVFAFEMRAKVQVPNYHLVFASKHPLGLSKMKEAMKGLDQDGSYRFTDSDVAQQKAFRFDDPEEWALALLARFAGQAIVDEEMLRDFALLETPFVDAKRMLRCLEDKGFLEVTPKGKRRKGTFKEGAISKFTFR